MTTEDQKHSTPSCSTCPQGKGSASRRTPASLPAEEGALTPPPLPVLRTCPRTVPSSRPRSLGTTAPSFLPLVMSHTIRLHTTHGPFPAHDGRVEWR